MAHTDVDRVNGKTIRKLHSPDKRKTFGYLVGVKDADGNLIEPQRESTLTGARLLAGADIKVNRRWS